MRLTRRGRIVVTLALVATMGAAIHVGYGKAVRGGNYCNAGGPCNTTNQPERN